VLEVATRSTGAASCHKATPARTLLDLATRLTPHDLERAVNEALVLRLTTPRDLILLGRRSSALEAALTNEPALTRSEAEARLLALIRAARLPPPRTNVKVTRYEVDFLWPGERLIVEVDGFAFHSSRAAFERDRTRDADLQAAGYRVTRVTWRQLIREPEAVVARVAGAGRSR
jgi:very-short-patch-repair endonuclease